jgi:hypothetical protein
MDPDLFHNSLIESKEIQKLGFRRNDLIEGVGLIPEASKCGLDCHGETMMDFYFLFVDLYPTSS